LRDNQCQFRKQAIAEAKRKAPKDHIKVTGGGNMKPSPTREQIKLSRRTKIRGACISGLALLICLAVLVVVKVRL